MNAICMRENVKRRKLGNVNAKIVPRRGGRSVMEMTHCMWTAYLPNAMIEATSGVRTINLHHNTTM